LIMISERKPEETHNGGSIAGGNDGFLYVSVGDGGGGLSEHAQNVNTVCESVLRRDVKKECARGYACPADNPFAGELGADGCDLAGKGGRPELFAWGIRNPSRMSF